MIKYFRELLDTLIQIRIRLTRIEHRLTVLHSAVQIKDGLPHIRVKEVLPGQGSKEQEPIKVGGKKLRQEL